MSKFNVGDRVRIVRCISDPSLVGEEVVIIGIARNIRNFHGEFNPISYRVDLPLSPNGLPWGFPPEALRKIGDELSSWDEIEKLTLWNPTKVEA